MLQFRTIVGDATPVRTPGHRRFPSTGFKAAHLAPSKAASSLPSMPVSPVHQRPPTSQPSGTHEAVLAALRIPIIHLLARSPATEASLAKTCRASAASVRDLLPKIAKRSTQDADKWQLTDKSFREINPYNFPYSTSEEREQAIEGAIKSFDRLRLTKDDKLWQILLPREERGQGKCLSRSKVKPLEAKPKASTPLHKVSDFTKKKPAAKKVDDKPTEKKADSEKKIKTVKEGSSKISKAVRDRIVPQDKPTVKEVKEDVTKAAAPTPAPISKAESKATSRPGPSTEAPKIKTKKVPTAGGTSSNTNTAPRTKPKMATARESYQDRQHRPVKPIYNTKPKNPSPLSASPPVNASDFEDNHPVHKALAAAASPVKSSYGNSDRSLKRKANDIDSNIHNHSLAVKKPNPDRVVHSRTPSHTNGRPNGSTPSSNTLQKRKPDDSSVTNTPTTAPKSRKVTNISVGLASRYNHNNSHPSPGDSSSSTTSPTIPSLSFRQTVELSQKFQKYYTKYEELYWRLTEATSPPTEAQRNDLLMMHKKLEEMKREIKAGARMQR